MSASPEFFKPAAPAFSPTCATQSPLPLVFGAGAGAEDYFRTPTGSGISYLREPTTCPPAPKKPPPPPPMCRKRLFQQAHSQAAQPAGAKGDQHQHQPAEPPVPVVISLRLDELERIFRPHPPPATTTTTIDKRRRSSSSSTSASASDNKQSS